MWLHNEMLFNLFKQMRSFGLESVGFYWNNIFFFLVGLKKLFLKKCSRDCNLAFVPSLVYINYNTINLQPKISLSLRKKIQIVYRLVYPKLAITLLTGNQKRVESFRQWNGILRVLFVYSQPHGKCSTPFSVKSHSDIRYVHEQFMSIFPSKSMITHVHLRKYLT